MAGGLDQATSDMPQRLLLVEDNTSEAEFLLDMLARELPRAEVTVVRTLKAALQTLDRDTPYDAMLADLALPDAQGLPVVLTLRKARPDTALVVLVGRTDHSMAMQAITAGAGDCLIKGMHDTRALLAAVHYARQRVRVEAARSRPRAAAWRNGQTPAMDSPLCAIGADGTILAVNAAWLAFMAANGGEAATCALGANYLAVCDEASGERAGGAAEVADGVRAVLAGKAPSFEFEYPCHAPTRERWFTVRVSPRADGRSALVSHQDVTALKLAERALFRVALRDGLTDLPNLALLSDRLEQALAEGSRSNLLVAVARLDLDRFSVINQTRGQGASDALLVEVAERLAQRLRDGDTLARVGDDEFVVVWRDLKVVDEALQLSARLAQVFETPFTANGSEVVLTASIGVSVDQWAQTAEELLLAANAAMYDAKRRGPGIVRVVTPEPGDSFIRTEANLRTALYREELVLHYQPVVDLTRGTVVGVEALVRWQHPTDGLLEPGLFIPVAEAGGLVVALGAWVLREACSQAVRWYLDGLHLDMAVNLSTRQVAHPDLVHTVGRVLRETNMDADHLVLEVTESAVMEDAEVAARVLSQVAALGVSLAIDDFGTGYSSLVYLKRYPIRALKIDRSFVAGMGLSDEDDAIVASVVGLARAVGGSCVAEGVETYEQYAALRALGCDYAQGWLFGRAVPAAELPGLVAECEREMANRHFTLPLTAEERELIGDEREQAAKEREHLADERDQAAQERELMANERDHVAEEREHAGDERDQAAAARERAADEREEAADRRDRAGPRRETGATLELTAGMAAALDGAAVARSEAAADRTQASWERQVEANERSQADHERDSALAERGVESGQRSVAEAGRTTAASERDASKRHRKWTAEALPGVRPRAEGFAELTKAIAAARQLNRSLIVAFVDVHRVRALTEAQGHGAADRLLREVAKTLAAGLRPADLIMRYGGDEFVCALPGVGLYEAKRRLEAVNAALATGPQQGSVTVGYAELTRHDSPGDLVARADAALARELQKARRTRA